MCHFLPIGCGIGRILVGSWLEGNLLSLSGGPEWLVLLAFSGFWLALSARFAKLFLRIEDADSVGNGESCSPSLSKTMSSGTFVIAGLLFWR